MVYYSISTHVSQLPDVVEYDKFREFTHSHVLLLFPAYEVQVNLHYYI